MLFQTQYVSNTKLLYIYLVTNFIHKFTLFQAKADKGPVIQERLVKVGKWYGELKELADLRKARLQDAQALYQLFSDADNIEAWIDEKVTIFLFIVEMVFIHLFIMNMLHYSKFPKQCNF